MGSKPGLWGHTVSLNSSFTGYQLCNWGQASNLQASFFLSVKWKNSSINHVGFLGETHT